MDVLTTLGIIGILVGIVAGIVQVLDYLQKRRQSRRDSQQESKTPEKVTPAPQEEVSATYLTQLRLMVTELFDENELRSLVFDLGLDYDNLAGRSKDERARELVAHMQRNGRLADLTSLAQSLRPHAPWKQEQEAIPGNLPAQTIPQTIPHNLPRRREFVGRTLEKAQVHEALCSNAYLISIEGIGGIGKSSLAREVAYDCLAASESDINDKKVATFEAFVWASAKDRELTLQILLDMIARTLDYPGIAQQPEEEEKLESVRKLLAHKKCLVIVDNFETITDAQLRQFLHELPEPSKALVTTRAQELPQARTIALGDMTQSEALTLMRYIGERVGLKAVEVAPDESLLRLYEVAGGAPLALIWAIGQIKQKGQSLDIVLTSLQKARGDIFTAVFSRSWSLLSSDAQYVLMVMPLFATSALREAIAAASDIHGSRLDAALGQAVELWLIEPAEHLDILERRFSIHPLTRSFASARLLENSAFEDEARHRLADYYITTSDQIGHWGTAAGFSWFESELPNMLDVLGWANKQEAWDIVKALFGKTSYFLGTSGYWQERVKYGKMALDAASRTDDQVAFTHFQGTLAWVAFKQSRNDEARRLYQSVVQKFLDLGRKKHAASGMIDLARIAVAEGQLEEANAFLSKAEETIDDTDYFFIAPNLLTTKGRIALEQRDFDSAQMFLTQAMEATEKKGMKSSVSSRLIDLGYVALAQDRLDDAVELFQAGLTSSRENYRQDNIAKAELGLARACAKQGKRTEAEQLARDAREKFERLLMQYEVEQVEQLLENVSTKTQYE